MSAGADLVRWLDTGSNWTGSDGILQRTGEHLLLTGTSLGLALVVALPVAVVLGHLGRGGFLAVNISNAGRAVPTIGVLMLLALWPPVGVGESAAVLALTLFAIPPILTNTYVGMRDVDPDVREAARGMGMTGRQLLRRVELPLALPLVAAGIRTAVVQVIATATLAALVGSGGLGRFIVDGNATQNDGEYLGGAVVVIVLAVVVEILLGFVQRALTPGAPRPGRRRTSQPEVTPVTPVP